MKKNETVVMSKHEKLLFVQNVSKLKKDEQIYILRKLIEQNFEMDESGKETLINMKDINGKLFTELNEYVCSCIKFNTNVQVQVKEHKELTDAQFDESLLEQQAKAHGLTLTEMKDSKKKLKTLINKMKHAKAGPNVKKTKSKPKTIDEDIVDKDDVVDLDADPDPLDTELVADIESVDGDLLEEEDNVDNDKFLDE